MILKLMQKNERLFYIRRDKAMIKKNKMGTLVLPDVKANGTD